MVTISCHSVMGQFAPPKPHSLGTKWKTRLVNTIPQQLFPVPPPPSPRPPSNQCPIHPLFTWLDNFSSSAIKPGCILHIHAGFDFALARCWHMTLLSLLWDNWTSEWVLWHTLKTSAHHSRDRHTAVCLGVECCPGCVCIYSMYSTVCRRSMCTLPPWKTLVTEQQQQQQQQQQN